MKKVIIIVLAVVLVAAGVFSYFFFFSGDKEEEIVLFSPGDFFVTNVKDSTKLLKITVVLGLNTDKENEYLTENTPIVRDVILQVLRQNTEDQLKNAESQETIRKELTSALKQRLEMDYLVTVYFSDFVIQ